MFRGCDDGSIGWFELPGAVAQRRVPGGDPQVDVGRFRVGAARQTQPRRRLRAAGRTFQTLVGGLVHHLRFGIELYRRRQAWIGSRYRFL